jgi:hypothetical protein
MTPKLNKHQRLTLALTRHPLFSEHWIRYGWAFLPDAPNGRHGWWRYASDGTPHYLGRTFAEAEKALQSPTC